MPTPTDQRERVARLAGIAVALAVMAAASRAVGWPAPGIAVALGYGVYLLTRRPRD